MLACAGIARAGAQGESGTVHGVVTDSAGRPVQGATLRFSGTETRRVSDANGRFSFERVPPGRYRITATMIGALPRLDSVVVRPTDTVRVGFVLQVMSFKPETLPPRFVRGTRPDSAPANAERLDLIARVGGFPVLRTNPPPRGHRELRLWYGGGIGIPDVMLRLRSDGAQVQGETIRYFVHTIFSSDDSPSARAMMDSAPQWLRNVFACDRVSTDTLRFSRPQLVAVCRSRYREEPDWAALLRELERHRVWTLPDASELPRIGNIVSLDGPGVTVEAWDGRRYRAYGYGATGLIPAPEARDAGEIQRRVVAFLNRTHEDLRSERR